MLLRLLLALDASQVRVLRLKTLTHLLVQLRADSRLLFVNGVELALELVILATGLPNALLLLCKFNFEIAHSSREHAQVVVKHLLGVSFGCDASAQFVKIRLLAGKFLIVLHLHLLLFVLVLRHELLLR